MDVLCGVAEYDELPVRHNEDKLNMTLSDSVRFPIKERDADDPHAKAKLLLQASSYPQQFRLNTACADIAYAGCNRPCCLGKLVYALVWPGC